MKFAVILFAALPLVAQVPKKRITSARAAAIARSARPASRSSSRRSRRQGLLSAADAIDRSRRSGPKAIGESRDYKSANDAFRAAVKLRPKDPNLRVRWGRMYLDHWQPADAADLFNEALEIDKEYAPALLGLALLAADGFEGKAVELAQHALSARSETGRSAGIAGARRARRQQFRKGRAEAKKALEISPEALDAMAILATIDWLDDKTDHAVDRQDPQNQSDVRRSVRNRRALLRHQSPL